MKWIVFNAQCTKGIIIEANESYEAIKKGNKEYYSPFPPKNDLCGAQLYRPNNHYFVRAAGNIKFDYVQYITMGGVATLYGVTIDQNPTEQIKKFLNIGERPIYAIKFFMEGNRY